MIWEMEIPSVIIAHDYQCPWCYLAFFQFERLKKEFPRLVFEWKGYELLPQARTEDKVIRPQPSERFKELAAIDDLPTPTAWPVVTNSHAALEGAEFVKKNRPELFSEYNESIYRAFWEEGKDISNHNTLAVIAEQVGIKKEDFLQAVSEKKYAKNIIPFKEAAYASGITHVTTFRFLGEQCAEATYSTISEMAKRHLAWYGD